jgi:hypothetical protein
MAKTIIEGFVFLYTPQSTKEKPVYTFCESDIHNDETFIKVCTHTIEAEVPDEFDPVPQQIAALNEKKRLLRVKLAEELAAVDDRISKLSAISYEPPVTVDALEDDKVFEDENIPF